MAGGQNKVTVLHSAADILSSLHLLLDFGGVSAHACAYHGGKTWGVLQMA